jgi:serine/alanine adding enzyme
MSIEVDTIKSTDVSAWDEYVHTHPHSTLYHLSGWENIISKTYGHKTYYLMAKKHNSKLETRNSKLKKSYKPKVIGVLPLVHLKHFLFGNSLLSIPFFDLGGILADDEETEKALLSQAIRVGQDLKVKNIELRHLKSLSWLAHSSQLTANAKKDIPMSYDLPLPREAQSMFHWGAMSYATKSHKVRMLLDLPESSEILMKLFKAKLRSQIKKPIKEGLESKIGDLELLEDFFKVFAINMRDLGSPVHSKTLMQNVFKEFPDKSKIIMVYKNDQPIACSLVIGFKETLENPWASSLRKYSRLSPNMLLYWTMLEYACDNGYAYFDFGRSSPDEGTYKFKEQWGARPSPLNWHSIYLKGKPENIEESEKSKFSKAIQCWQKLPVPATKILGPMIRKYIGL